MFDFVNYTYSGILSVLSTLFGLSYPLVIGCIEKIDDKFGSTKLSERFMSEISFKWFKTSLVINLVMAVVFPFLMDGCVHARLIMGVQCVGAIVLVSSALFLFSKIITYYNITDLQKAILNNYKDAVSKTDKAKESKYFTQWIDLSGELLKSADNELVQSVYEVLYDYVVRVHSENRGRALVFDLYYYEGISRINEFLSKGESQPISVNNGNSILTSLILMDSVVSETTYRYLWRNLRIQMFYNKDVWIMEYWKMASQKIGLFMKPIHQYIYDEEGKPYSQEQIEEKQKQRENFMEFHIMLCAMLIQEKKYRLLELMLSFTQSEPPSYPLVPSNISDIIDAFNKINHNSFVDPFYYESRYQMPNMHGITEGKIVGAANCYLALLAYRIYVIRWNYGYESVLNTGALPDSLSELNTLRENLDVFKRWLERINSNKELLDIIGFSSFDKVIEEKAQLYDKTILLRPDELTSRMQNEILNKMEQLRTSLPLSEEKVDSVEGELTGNIIRAVAPYGDLFGRRFSQDNCYNLNSSVTMPFPNTAFVDNPDVGHAGIAGCMSSYMLHNFQHMFASSFFAEHSLTDYSLSSEDLFQAIDKLNLNKQHYIIAFGLYFDYYIGSIKDLKKETDHKYSYKGIKILSLDCSTEFFSQMVYVMRFEDRPSLDFHEPTAEEQQKLCLKEMNDLYGLWLSLEKISKHPELLEEPIKTKLGDKANQYSLFTAIWGPKLFFKSDKYPIVSIKIKYRLTNEGEYDNVDKVMPFIPTEEASVNQENE
ncbi:MAG: hypothetical protein Q4F47_00315 [Bacteroidaceae bacterium]|nr:hypothetical protein [Bacteroidaceae bacterium]